ncbi:ATP-binding protein [Streptomyces sp. NPDC001796]|uniref:ATP-binding protein n=1 Tax=Streptomyces sp. NPDC001796 TaxID=3364609 RepID=UPI003699CC1A
MRPPGGAVPHPASTRQPYADAEPCNDHGRRLVPGLPPEGGDRRPRRAESPASSVHRGGYAADASWDLPNEPVTVTTARRLAARQLREWGLEPLVTPVESIVSELVANAIRHGGGPSRLRLIQHRVLTCEVFDSHTGQPRSRRPHTLDEHGRGLHLVAQLSRRWGSRCATDGKVVWAEQDLPARAGAL